MGHMALSLVRAFLRSFLLLWDEYGAEQMGMQDDESARVGP